MMELSCPPILGVSDLGLPRILLLHSKGIQSFVPPRVNQLNPICKGPAITLVWPQERKWSHVGVVRQGPDRSYCARIDDIKGDRATENEKRNFWWIDRNIFEEPNGNF